MLFIVLFWDFESKDYLKRSVFIFFSTLSSPAFIITLPGMWVRLYISKNALEFKLTLFATFLAAIQSFLILNHSKAITLSINDINLTNLSKIISAFFGSYITINAQQELQLFFGYLFLIFYLIVILQKKNLILISLIYLLFSSIIISISRVDINIIHPIFAGPRYFFFPFIIQSWILLQITLSNYNYYIKIISSILLILSIINAIPILTRSHDELHWENHILSCKYFDNYRIPVHSDGNIAHAWSFSINKKNCPHNANSMLSSPYTFAYRVIDNKYNITKKSDKWINLNRFPKEENIINNTLHGKDYYSIANGVSSFNGWKILGSFNQTNIENGELIIHMRRGQQIWFRSEPKAFKQKIIIDGKKQYLNKTPATFDWVLLEFSNSTLPNEFNVTFIDGGDGWGEWFAIAIPNN